MSNFLSAIRRKIDPFAPSGDPNASVNADWGSGGDPTRQSGQDWSAPQYSPQSATDQSSDPYLPQLKHVADQLSSIYQPGPATKRQMIGRGIGLLLPRVGGFISGDTERAKQAQGLQQEYGLLSNIQQQNRTAQMQGLNAENIRSEISDRGVQAQQREKMLNAPEKVTPEEQIFKGYLAKNNGDPVAANEEMKADAQKAAPEEGMKYSTLQLPTGAKVPGKEDKKGNLLLADGTPAPKGTVTYQQPNYGQMVLPTKTQTMLGPDNIAHDYSWNPQTSKFDIDQGISTTGAYGHQMQQAGAVSRSGKDLIADVEKHRDKMGNVKAILESAFLGTPLADPEQAGLSTHIASYAALQPGMHQMRGTAAMDEFVKRLGGLPNNPDALIASINAMEQNAGAINPAILQQTPAAQTSGGFAAWKKGKK